MSLGLAEAVGARMHSKVVRCDWWGGQARAGPDDIVAIGWSLPAGGKEARKKAAAMIWGSEHEFWARWSQWRYLGTCSEG